MFMSFSWILVYIYTVIVTYLMTAPIHGRQLFPHEDKVIHFTLYFLMSLCVYEACRKSKFVKPFLAAFIYSAAVGTVLECSQIFIPYRSFELGDILANMIGAFIGVVIVKRIPILMSKT
jgi:VanZ family protein